MCNGSLRASQFSPDRHWTSAVLEPPALPRNSGAGCDVAVEEEGRGGAWRGDVLPRWRRESEETVSPVGLL